MIDKNIFFLYYLYYIMGDLNFKILRKYFICILLLNMGYMLSSIFYLL